MHETSDNPTSLEIVQVDTIHYTPPLTPIIHAWASGSGRAFSNPHPRAEQARAYYRAILAGNGQVGSSGGYDSRPSEHVPQYPRRAQAQTPRQEGPGGAHFRGHAALDGGFAGVCSGKLEFGPGRQRARPSRRFTSTV